MRQIASFGDERQAAACAYCRGTTRTRDHVPARVLLDEPFPENLPVVPACLDCNNSASADEEYLACLVECVIRGTTEPAAMQREKVRRLLTERESLRARLDAARTTHDGQCVFSVEVERVKRVLLKLARGHSLFELNEPHPTQPDSMFMLPLALMDADRLEEFERPAGGLSVWPEVGSRAMQRLLAEGEGWVTVQAGRYRYMATADSEVRVRMVLSEYLACEVVWS